MKNKYDIVVIGSGYGGLLISNILSKKGYKVAIIEKNDHYGGCLQSYEAGGVVFDTGIHYMGSLKEGQLINRIFKYLNIFDNLNLRELDPDGFDHFRIGENEYTYPAGFTNFQKRARRS
jgi:phytoene dehydrogenase-like protein